MPAFAIYANRLGIDVWEAIGAASFGQDVFACPNNQQPDRVLSARNSIR